MGSQACALPSAPGGTRKIQVREGEGNRETTDLGQGETNGGQPTIAFFFFWGGEQPASDGPSVRPPGRRFPHTLPLASVRKKLGKKHFSLFPEAAAPIGHPDGRSRGFRSLTPTPHDVHHPDAPTRSEINGDGGPGGSQRVLVSCGVAMVVRALSGY